MNLSKYNIKLQTKTIKRRNGLKELFKTLKRLLKCNSLSSKDIPRKLNDSIKSVYFWELSQTVPDEMSSFLDQTAEIRRLISF